MIFIRSQDENKFRELVNRVLDDLESKGIKRLPFVNYKDISTWESIDTLLKILGTKTGRYSGIHLNTKD